MAGGYCLGVDIGTTYTAAAVWRDGVVEVAHLGNRTPVVPSLVAVLADGAVLVGEAAARRAATDPERVAREFKRRIGDPAPILVGGSPFSADGLTGMLLRWVVDKVTETQGAAPSAIAVSHPANWTEYKRDLLRQATSRADLDDVVLVTEPEAAAIHYASQARVGAGAVVAVYDLGGGTFDAAVLRKTAGGWEILGRPEGIERLGGIDFDAAVFDHVVGVAGAPVGTLEAARLRQDCVEAKEALSSDTAVSIPSTHTPVRLTRAEFEDMVRAPLADTITALGRSLASTGLTAADVTAVLLVGGSSRIPLVGQLVGAALARPVAVDAHPKHGVALGAAIVAAEAPAGRPPPPPPRPPARPRRARLALVGVVAAAAAVAGLLALRNSGGEGREGGEVPQFDQEFQGEAGEGDQLIDWLLAREGDAVHLDLSFSEPPAETSSPMLWTGCPDVPAGEPPSIGAGCEPWVLHVRSDDPDTPPFFETRGRTHLEGYFVVAAVDGPHQGITSIALDAVSADAALD